MKSGDPNAPVREGSAPQHKITGRTYQLVLSIEEIGEESKIQQKFWNRKSKYNHRKIGSKKTKFTRNPKSPKIFGERKRDRR